MATLNLVTGKTAAARSRWITAWVQERPQDRLAVRNLDLDQAIKAVERGVDVAFDFPDIPTKVIDVA